MNILITGTSSGIGKATAELLGRDKNNSIIGISRRPFTGINANNNIRNIEFDLLNGNIETDLVPILKKAFNTIDIVINNAAMIVVKPLELITLKEWSDLFTLNVFAAAGLIKAVLPMLTAAAKVSGRSHVVNIASMGGVQGSQKFPGLSAYSSTKGALATLTECLAVEFSNRNIAVNCLCPGSVETDMLTKAFPGAHTEVTAEMMATYVAWFCLHGHETMNGKVIPVSLN